ncbi:hypothetical protein GVX82_01535 [Patescibacteria group bacterium]|nr:hypothetical protein [Patescibacteria group bacterium]
MQHVTLASNERSEVGVLCEGGVGVDERSRLLPRDLDKLAVFEGLCPEARCTLL